MALLKAAQYPPNLFRNARNNIVLDHNHDEFQQLNNNLSTASCLINYGKQQIINGGGGGTVLSDLAESELTCNLSASRKRNRVVEDVCDQMPNFNNTLLQSYYLHHHHQQQQQQNFGYLKLQKGETVLNRASESDRLHNSERGISTNGRRSSSSSSSSSSSIVTCSNLNSSPHQQILNSHLIHHQNLEIDSLILLHNQKLRSVIEETQKRNCRSIVSIIEQHILKRLEEKETELQKASYRNSELEEKIKELMGENEIWFNITKNNETIVSNLKSTLQKILLKNTTSNVDDKEGYGDNEGLVIPGLESQGFVVVKSCSYKEEEEDRRSRRRKTLIELSEQEMIQETVSSDEKKKKKKKSRTGSSCKVCEENEVSVLVLPCRHLCLCKDCESKIDYCPICNSIKNASLQIFIS